MGGSTVQDSVRMGLTKGAVRGKALRCLVTGVLLAPALGNAPHECLPRQVGTAWARAKREATTRVEEGRRNFEAFARHIGSIDVVDELDRCMDSMALSVEDTVTRIQGGIARIPRPQDMLNDACSTVYNQIDCSIERLCSAVSEVSTPLLSSFTSRAEGGLMRLQSNGEEGTRSMMGVRPRRSAREQIDSLNERALRSVLKFVDEQDGWEHVTTSENVTVYRKYLDLAGLSGGIFIDRNGALDICDAEKSEGIGKFACVKAVGVIDAPVDKVFELFLDNKRVHEYNEHCREIADIDRLSSDTKVTWSASGRYGPFKARDFCTIVHYRRLKDGSLVVINRSAEHTKAPRSDKYVRSQILLAGNVMRPHPRDPSKTVLVSLTHVNPGGCVDTKAGAMMVNMITTTSPVSFIKKVEVAARRGLEPVATPRPGQGLREWALGVTQNFASPATTVV